MRQLILVAILLLSRAAAPATTHSVKLTWQAGAVYVDWTSYNIYKAGSDGVYTLRAVTGTAQPFFNDTQVVTQTSYSYYVTAFDHKTGFESAASNVVGVTVP